jgi:predicted alpha/beta-hydrolase family hydrolase
MSLEQIAGIAHEPNGAGGSRESPLLKKICDEWARRGWLAVRYNLPYRRRRPKGPPSGSAKTDQAGVIEAIELAHTLTDGPVIAGGHSYGGRMTSMVIADSNNAVADIDVLTLFSYPLHPPGKPERARTEHLPLISVPTVFTHGTADPFGSIDELRPAAALIPAPTEIVEVTGARHDLGSKSIDVPTLAVDAALRLLAR